LRNKNDTVIVTNNMHKRIKITLKNSGQNSGKRSIRPVNEKSKLPYYWGTILVGLVVAEQQQQ